MTGVLVLRFGVRAPDRDWFDDLCDELYRDLPEVIGQRYGVEVVWAGHDDTPKEQTG